MDGGRGTDEDDRIGIYTFIYRAKMENMPVILVEMNEWNVLLVLVEIDEGNLHEQNERSLNNCTVFKRKRTNPI